MSSLSDSSAERPGDLTSLSLPSPLYAARFVGRPNRFVVHACLEPGRLPEGWVAGDEVVCHMADPGRLKELLQPGRILRIRFAPAPHRKTDWSVVLVEAPDGREWVSVDTTLPNRLVAAALKAEALDEFAGWRLAGTEFAHGRSRLDFLLANAAGRRQAVEVKSVTLVEDGEALFPDAVTARGTRHLRELTELAGRDGWEAAVLFVVQRSDAQRIRAAESIDPDFARALAEAKDAGVRILGRRCRVSLERVVLGDRVPAE